MCCRAWTSCKVSAWQRTLSSPSISRLSLVDTVFFWISLAIPRNFSLLAARKHVICMRNTCEHFCACLEILRERKIICWMLVSEGKSERKIPTFSSRASRPRKLIKLGVRSRQLSVFSCISDCLEIKSKPKSFKKVGKIRLFMRRKSGKPVKTKLKS